jgi:hypothetical protein
MVAAMSTGRRETASVRERPGRRPRRPGPARDKHKARAGAAALGAGLCAALLAGCAGDGAAADSRPPTGAGDSAEAISAAADTLVKAGTSHVRTTMRMASGGTWLTITGSGGFDYARRQGELRLLLPPDAAGTEEHKPLTELLTPGALYMKDRGAGVPAGKWVRVDTARLPDGNLVTGGATEPLAAAQLLCGARDVRLVGKETLAGTKVSHYRGSADIARAAKVAEPSGQGPLTAASKGFSVTRVPFDAWLDGQGRLRQLSQTFTFSSGSAGHSAGADVTVVSTTSFDDFGAAVPVSMPRAADIWTGKIVSAQPG